MSNRPASEYVQPDTTFTAVFVGMHLCVSGMNGVRGASYEYREPLTELGVPLSP